SAAQPLCLRPDRPLGTACIGFAYTIKFVDASAVDAGYCEITTGSFAETKDSSVGEAELLPMVRETKSDEHRSAHRCPLAGHLQQLLPSRNRHRGGRSFRGRQLAGATTESKC